MEVFSPEGKKCRGNMMPEKITVSVKKDQYISYIQDKIGRNFILEFLPET